MNPSTFSRLARRLMRCSAVAYQEDAVREEVRRICREHDLPVRSDCHGNLHVRWKRGRGRRRPLTLVAHMDHPGFEVLRAVRGREGRWVARFLGGVGESYFKQGVRLRLEPGHRPARLGRALPGRKTYEILETRPSGTSSSPRMAVWDLPCFEREGRLVRGRACDDLVGVAALLAVIIECRRARRDVHVRGLITRAEEIGFQGALAAAEFGNVSRRALVVSLETSKETASAPMGKGVIIRVGDRASVFDTEATRYLAEVAAGLGKRKKGFCHQRALMGGGTCEATVFQEWGYQTGAVCVALGHYHNCGEKDVIAAEYVHLGDVCGMVDLLVEAAAQMGHFDRLTGRLRKRLEGLLWEGQRRLR